VGEKTMNKDPNAMKGEDMSGYIFHSWREGLFNYGLWIMNYEWEKT
jgi:hypothetical protein